MTDSSYIPLFYRRQGGNEMVVKNGGHIKVEAGGSARNGSGAATVFSPNVTSIVELTQAAYDALSPPDASTLYVIVG